jgi:hypothetical protein
VKCRCGLRLSRRCESSNWPVRQVAATDGPWAARIPGYRPPHRGRNLSIPFRDAFVVVMPTSILKHQMDILTTVRKGAVIIIYNADR